MCFKNPWSHGVDPRWIDTRKKLSKASKPAADDWAV